MPLVYTSEKVPMIGGFGFLARDRRRNTVAVYATAESIEGYGERAVKAKGREKYDAGRFARENPRIVVVTTADFRKS